MEFKEMTEKKKFDHTMKLKRQLYKAKKEAGIRTEKDDGDTLETKAHLSSTDIATEKSQNSNKGKFFKKPDPFHEAKAIAEDRRKMKQDKEKEFQRRQAEKQRKIQKRQDTSSKLLKKTRKGQPIMKYKIDYLLQKITERNYN